MLYFGRCSEREVERRVDERNTRRASEAVAVIMNKIREEKFTLGCYREVEEGAKMGFSLCNVVTLSSNVMRPELV